MQTAQPDNNPDLEGLMGAGVVDLDALTQALTAERCSLRLEQTATGTVATWSPVMGAGSYDLVRGEVGNNGVDSDDNPHSSGAEDCAGGP